MTHNGGFVVLSILIAIAAAYGGLRAFLARQGGVQLMLSAIAFGIAVSGMHYTAMYGMRLVSAAEGHRHDEGLAASPQILALVVALLCFVIAAGFLLSLVPDGRGRPPRMRRWFRMRPSPRAEPAPAPRLRAMPLGGVGQPRTVPAPRLPVEGADGTHFIDAADIRRVRADAHYTKVHDGTRERMCPWSISEAEAQLDPEPVRPGAPQPYRRDPPCLVRPQGGRRRRDRARRAVAAPGAGQPRQNRRGEGAPRPCAPPRLSFEAR